LEFVKKVQAKIAENDPKFLSFEISILFLLVFFSIGANFDVYFS
jgi:hypothetical protein